MPAKSSLPSFLSRMLRSKRPLYVLAIAALIGVAAWANSAWAAAAASSSTNSTISPAIKLAAGTLTLEGTDQAVDATSAARLLPLWQLLAQLENSASTAPEEITAVVDEIKLNMTSAQMKTIAAMSFSQAELGSGSANGPAAETSSTQVASPASDPMLGAGIPAGGIPMDGGGPMPTGSSQRTSTSKSSASTSASAVPAVIGQVIQLLQSKIQN